MNLINLKTCSSSTRVFLFFYNNRGQNKSQKMKRRKEDSIFIIFFKTIPSILYISTLNSKSSNNSLTHGQPFEIQKMCFKKGLNMGLF